MRNEKPPIPKHLQDWQAKCLLIIADAELQLSASGYAHRCENPQRSLATLEICRLKTWVRLGCPVEQATGAPHAGSMPLDLHGPAKAVLSVLCARLAAEVPVARPVVADERLVEHCLT